eukprot:96090-Rhodomonas_salina.2
MTIGGHPTVGLYDTRTLRALYGCLRAVTRLKARCVPRPDESAQEIGPTRRNCVPALQNLAVRNLKEIWMNLKAPTVTSSFNQYWVIKNRVRGKTM